MAQQRRRWEEKWKIVEPLGKGGQGITTLVASNDGTTPKAVLKKLKNNRDRQSRGRMFREVGSLRVLHNAGCAVPKVLDDNADTFEEEGSELYVVMEHIPGPTLAQLIRDGAPVSLDKAAAIVSGMASIVSIAHRENILHRDIKPDNIIVRDLEKNDVVVIDYGLSFNVDDDDLTRMSETIRNKFLDLPENNTPGGNRRDSRSDVTALCGILYFCLTGHTPGHLQSSDGRLPHMRPGFAVSERLPDEPRVRQLQTLFDCGFSPSIEFRFQSVQEFLDRLKMCMAAGTNEVLDDPIAVAQRASERLRRGDRKTQLREFMAPGQHVTNSIAKYINTVHQKLGRFRLAMTSASLNHPFPAGIDIVPDVDVTCQVNAAYHNQIHQVRYRVGSRGEQCVVMRLELLRTVENQPFATHGDWQEILWFDGSTSPDTDLVLRDVRRWLNMAMEDLSQRIAP